MSFDSDADDKVVYDGFTHKQLAVAFDAVRNRADWKREICAIIPVADRKVVEAAIVFYTATIPEFYSLRGDRLQVQAEGYRMGPAGDH